MNRHGVYYVTGGLRSGKSLICTRKIQEFLTQGRKVVTNFDLKLEYMLPASKKNVCCLRIPDHPTVDDLEKIGLGYDNDDPEHYDESQFGLIVLDELGTWMNSRNWQDKTRRPVIDWLLHSGKRRWILMLIIQDLELLDNQAKAATANQFVVRCRRIGDYAVPVLSPIFKLFFGRTLTLPNGHIAVVRNGADYNALVADRWMYRGDDLFKAYNTRQIFMPRDSTDAVMLYSYLSPWHLKGRYQIVKDFKYWNNWLKDRPFLLAGAFSFLLFASALSFGFSLYLSSKFSRSQQLLMLAVNDLATLKNAPPVVQSAVPAAKSSVLPASMPVDDKARCDEVMADYKGYILAGYTRYPKGATYILRNNDYEFSSSRLLSLGFMVASYSACHMSISKDGCKQDIYCPSSAPARGDHGAAGVTASKGAGEHLIDGFKTGLKTAL